MQKYAAVPWDGGVLRVDKPLPCVQSFLLTGGARGGEARLESDQMPR